MAKQPDLSKMSLDELKALAKGVHKAIEEFEAKQRRDALAAVKAAAKEYGYTLEELTGAPSKRAKAKNPPKYVHPENAKMTWSGLGRQPAWIKEAIAAGKSLDEFAI